MAGHETYSLDDVELQSGVTLPHLELAFATYGELNAARDNVVVMPTFYAAQHSDTEAMIGAGRALDPEKYFIVVPNMLGSGLSSSPSTTPPPFDRAAFPNVTIYDNVACQYRLVREHLGVDRVRLVVGYSMGAQQAFQWGALHSDIVEAIAPFCGSARTSPHNRLFLDGIRAALLADETYADGRYEGVPVKGMHAFGVVYAGWAFSQDFFRDEEYRKLGMNSVDDVVAFVEAYFGRRDPNDLLAMLSTWWHADISMNERFNGDLTAALRTITARAIVMPCESDLYFRVRDNELEVAEMPNAELRPIPSIWGHAAGLGANGADNEFIDKALSELLTP